MKRAIIAFTLYAGITLSMIRPVSAQSKAKLEIVSTFLTERPGNIAVSPEGRVFVTMSNEGTTRYLLKEILPDGTAIDFPDTSWVKKPSLTSVKGINAVIGIQITSDNILWLLDMGNRSVNPVQAAKLVGLNIKTGKLAHVYPLPDAVLHPSSFLQDFIIDEKHQVAVLADMTMGGMILPATPAFVVVDLKTGYSRRILENHISFQPLDEPVVVNGRAIRHRMPNGDEYQPRYPLNPISIDKEMNWIYYGALGGNKIYRIPSEAVADENLSEQKLSGKIEYYATKPKSDGFKVGKSGKVYVTDVENNAVGVATPKGYLQLARDTEKLSWPDGLALSGQGYLYIVADQLQNKPWWNNNEDVSKPPYYILRIKID